MALTGLFASGTFASLGEQVGQARDMSGQLLHDLYGAGQAALLAVGTALVGILALAIWS